MKDERVSMKKKFGGEVQLSIAEILEHTKELECSCPEEVVQILRAVRSLIDQQRTCLLENPRGVVVHTWLAGEALQLESGVVRILCELLQRENILNSDLEFQQKIF